LADLIVRILQYLVILISLSTRNNLLGVVMSESEIIGLLMEHKNQIMMLYTNFILLCALVIGVNVYLRNYGLIDKYNKTLLIIFGLFSLSFIIGWVQNLYSLMKYSMVLASSHGSELPYIQNLGFIDVLLSFFFFVAFPIFLMMVMSNRDLN